MTDTEGKAHAPTNERREFGEQFSFLPPAPFNPKWPAPDTLADRALGMLMDGRSINHKDFLDATQSWRLAAAICTLRTLGWPVETVEVPSPTEHDPYRAIARYHLGWKYIKQARELAKHLGNSK